MLKKHSKLIVLLVAMAFMFSFVATAGAAAFSDVSGNKAAGDIYKLNALGIINGYPDGTFKPDANVTRAEFAKIAVYTAGLQGVASGMAKTPSQFKDVATGDWFNGWVNVAAAQGFVKGYPDGSFKPQAPVTQAEVITVFMRILGYNDNLPGNWPSDYIAKAANLDLLDDIVFQADKAATRGEVAILGSATLDADVVTYKASENVFEKSGDTLLADKFGADAGLVKKARVANVDLSDGKVALTFKTDGGTAVTLDLASDCVLANAPSWNQVKERYVDYMTNDDGDVNWIKVHDDYKVLKFEPDKIKIETVSTTTYLPTKVKLDGKTYECLSDVVVIENSAVGTGKWKVEGNYTGTVDAVDFVLNKDGKIGLIKEWLWPASGAGIVDTVNTKNPKISFKNGVAAITLDKDDPTSYYVLKNGLPASLSDIKENDVVWHSPTGYNVHLIIDVAAQVPGTVDGIKTDTDNNLTKMNIGGTWFKVALDGYSLSTDNGDTFDLWKAAGHNTAKYVDGTVNDLLGKKVTVLGSPEKKIVGIISDVEGSDSSKIYGIVLNEDAQVVVNGGVEKGIKIFKADGTKATYQVDSDTDYNGYKGLIDNGDLIAFTVTSDGVIDKITDLVDYTSKTKLADGDTDLNKIKIGSEWYNTDKLVVFNVYDFVQPNSDDDPVTVGVSDFVDFVKANKNSDAGVIYDSPDLKYVVVNLASLAGEKKGAMVSDIAKNSDGWYVKLLFKDGEKQYQLKNDSDKSKIQDDSVIFYSLSAGKLVYEATAVKGSGEVVKVSSGLIRVKTGASTYTSYMLDDDTLFYDNTDDDPICIEAGDIGIGDKVKIYDTDNDDIADVVEIVKP